MRVQDDRQSYTTSWSEKRWGRFEMINVTLNTSNEGIPKAVRRDFLAWRLTSENLLVSEPLWYHPARCQPSQFILTAGEVGRESRPSYPRRIGWATGIFGSGETVVAYGRCGGTDSTGNFGGAEL